MRLLLLHSICLLVTFSVEAQLEGVQVQVVETENGFSVTEEIRVHEERPTAIELKALVFDGSEIIGISIFGVNELNYVTASDEDIIVLKVDLKDFKEDLLHIRYTVRIDQEAFYLPVFFTNWTANSSAKDFFNLQFEHPKDREYFIHFPTVNSNKTTSNDVSIINLELLALPSTLRMERINSESGTPNYIVMVDWGVAIVFLIVGYLIWHYRKKLIYG